MISVEEAIARIKAGKQIILVDDEDRENEGDLVIAAECISAAEINFMAAEGRGLIRRLAREEHLDDRMAGRRVEIAGWLIGKQQVRAMCQCPGDRDTLLFATGQIASRLLPPLGKAREEIHHPVIRLLGLGLVLHGEPAGGEILVHRELGKHSAPLHHLRDAGLDNLRRLCVGDVLPFPRDRSLGGLAFVHVKQARDGADRGGLAGTVGPEKSDDVTFGDFDGQATQNEDYFVVNDLEVGDFEQESILGRSGGRSVDDRPAGRHPRRCHPARSINGSRRRAA